MLAGIGLCIFVKPFGFNVIKKYFIRNNNKELCGSCDYSVTLR